jgi:predicted secreted hydrolase
VNQVRYLFAVLLIAVLLLPACDSSEQQLQGSDFSVLAQHAESYEQARPGQRLSFPHDQGPHPEYRIEWWYLTANLSDPEGNDYGAQWTLFRLAVQTPGKNDLDRDWRSDQVFMAHFAITTPDDHVSFQRYARGAQELSLARAGVEAKPFSAWLDDWTLKSTETGWLPLVVKAQQDDHALELQLQSTASPILQGDAGFSQKHPDGGGSFYYSQPFLQAGGELIVAGQTIPVSGEAWLDREWGSQFLQADQQGWDWFSIHLESGEKLVLFQLRQQAAGNQRDNYLHGSLIETDGGKTALNPEQIQLKVLKETIVMGRNLPMQWQVNLPQIGRKIRIEALHPDQWMDVDFPYWEGVIIASGNGPESRGRGYMELTGYPVNFSQ